MLSSIENQGNRLASWNTIPNFSSAAGVPAAALPEVLPADEDVAAGRGDQTGEDPQQGGLAASGATDERDELTGLHGERDAAQRLGGGAAAAPVDLVDVAQLQLRRARAGAGDPSCVDLGSAGQLAHDDAPGSRSLVNQVLASRPPGTSCSASASS